MHAPEIRSHDEGHAATVQRFQPRSFPQRLETVAALDEHYAHHWLQHAARLLGRPHLDLRTRLLTLAGQFTMVQDHEALADTVEAALDADVDPREVLEVVIQCHVYSGGIKIARSCAVLQDAFERRGLLEDVQRRQLHRDATRQGRDLTAERERWAEGDRDDPRLERLLERYGPWGLSTGLRLRPGHHLNLVATLDALDPDFASIWLDVVNEGLYTRGVLDERTRLLCVIADCLAVGQTHQAPRHMRSALRNGAAPREILEVVFQTTAVFGHPNVMPLAVDDVIVIADELGRLDELVDGDRIDEIREVTAARVARRHGTQDMPSSR